MLCKTLYQTERYRPLTNFQHNPSSIQAYQPRLQNILDFIESIPALKSAALEHNIIPEPSLVAKVTWKSLVYMAELRQYGSYELNLTYIKTDPQITQEPYRNFLLATFVLTTEIFQGSVQNDTLKAIDSFGLFTPKYEQPNRDNDTSFKSKLSVIIKTIREFRDTIH